MADQWIVSDYKYKRQKTLEIATEEMARLAALHPEKKFRIYRVKPTLNPSASKQMLADQAEEIEALRGALHGVIGYALTSRSGSKEWLQGMADEINKAADALCDTDKAVVQGDGLRIKRLGA